MSTPFDTLSAARSLEASGIESKQAEAIVGAIRASVEASVTKTDLTASTNELRGEMKALATELRGEMKTMAAELRGEISFRREQDAACPTRHCCVAVYCAAYLWVGGLRIDRDAPRHPYPHLRDSKRREGLPEAVFRPFCSPLSPVRPIRGWVRDRPPRSPRLTFHNIKGVFFRLRSAGFAEFHRFHRHYYMSYILLTCS